MPPVIPSCQAGRASLSGIQNRGVGRHPERRGHTHERNEQHNGHFSMPASGSSRNERELKGNSSRGRVAFRAAVPFFISFWLVGREPVPVEMDPQYAAHFAHAVDPSVLDASPTLRSGCRPDLRSLVARPDQRRTRRTGSSTRPINSHLTSITGISPTVSNASMNWRIENRSPSSCARSLMRRSTSIFPIT